MTNFIFGKNAVLQNLLAEKTTHRILLGRYLKTDEKIHEIQVLAAQQRIPVTLADKKELDKIAMTDGHQGIIAYIREFQYVEVQDILDYAESRNEHPFLLLLDDIEDPYNMGSLIRTAVCAGVHGMIIPNKKQVAVNQTVVKVSTGATAHLRIAKVANIAQIAESLKKKGIWIMGTHQDGGQSYLETDFNLPLALVIGNEGRGMSRLLKERCDFLIQIPMADQMITSLNASVSGAIIMFKIKEFRL